MRKILKGGLVLVALLAGNAHADLMGFDLTGTVNYAYGNGISQGDLAKFSFTFDTSAAPGNSYNYSDPGYFSYSQNDFSNAVGSISAQVGNYALSSPSGSNYAYAYNENVYGTNYSGAEVYSYSYNGSSFNEFGVYNSSNNPVNIQDFAAAMLSGGVNGLSFFLYSYDYSNWSSYTYASGTFDTITSSAASPAAVPLPAAIWLFGSALIGLMGITKKKAAFSPMPA